MKMKIFNLYYCLAALLVAVLSAGCTDDLELPAPDPDLSELEKYYFILGDPVATRSVDYQTDEHSEFTGGELLGCFALDADDNAVVGVKANACYAVSVIASKDETKNGRKILVPNTPSDKLDKGYAKYLFYYPYNKDITSLDELKDLTYSVEPDQNKHEDYEASDLLWDVAKPEGGICRVEMDHVMANIIIVIDGVEYDVERGAVVLQQPLTAENIDLTAPTIDDMRDVEGAYYYSVYDAQEKHDIQAMYALYSSANDRFRTVVPANRTLKAGDDIIKLWSRETGNEKTFRLKNDVRLEAGKNYYFTLIKKGKPQPGLDDDSWVLDVLDPETGEPVGLLCREYLRWQRSNDPNVKDHPTVPDDGNGQACLNSQAWVFYNLKSPNSRIPDLSTGTVLRFVYDVRENLAKQSAGAGDDDPNGVNWNGYIWPFPHKKGTGKGFDVSGVGVFLANHGYGWSEKDGYGVPDNPDAFIGEYYMHGGTVIWDNVKNQIERFMMPEQAFSATNTDAERYGHIAIPRNLEDGEPFVSYKPYDNDEYAGKYKVGFVMPHYLIDTRVGFDGKVEQRRYPLVKIGFNQFWMSKSFRGKTLLDGTPMECYNIGKFQMADFNNVYQGKLYESGYLYPFLKGSNDNERCDPLYESDMGMEYADEIVQIPLLYNHTAFIDKNIVPISVEGISEYKRPEWKDYKDLHDYLGFISIVKLMSNSIQCVGNNNFKESDRDAFLSGKYFNAQFESYSGNVSGFNLKACGGHLRTEVDFLSIGKGGGFWVNSDDLSRGIISIFYHMYDSWQISPMDGRSLIDNQQTFPYIFGDNYGNGVGLRTTTFNQIRFFLEYKGQGKPNMTRSMTTSRSASRAEDCRDVYVAVE